jgi:hypothetical protein
MEIDVMILYHRKVRKLQRLYPLTWEQHFVAWMALMGEAWHEKDRTVTLEQAWHPASNADPEVSAVALRECGLIDTDHRVPENAWSEWFVVVEAALKAASDKGKMMANARWHPEDKTYSGASAAAEREPSSSRRA